MSIVSAVTQRLDAWVNPITGQGTSSDPSTASQALPGIPVSKEEATALLHEDGVGQRIAVRPVADALRDPPELHLDGEDDSQELVAEMREFCRDMHVWQQVRMAAISARGYGGGVLFMGFKGQDWRKPLDLDNPGELTHVTYFSPVDIDIAGVQNNPFLPGYGDPTRYRLQGLLSSPDGGKAYLNPNMSEVHASRCILFRGEETERRRRENNAHWDDGIFTRLRNALRDNETAWSSSTALIAKSNMLALKLQGLRQVLMGTVGAEESMARRLEIIRMGIGVLKMIAVDADKEEITNISASFGGLPEMLDRNMVRVSAESGIPVTILWQRSPAGQNSTGDSDWRNWEDFVAEFRSSRLDRPIEQLFRTILASDNGPSMGKVPDRVALKWKPLRRPTDDEESQIRLRDAQMAALMIDASVFRREEVALAFGSANGYTRDIEVDADLLRASLDGWDPVAEREQSDELSAQALDAAANPPAPPAADSEA